MRQNSKTRPTCGSQAFLHHQPYSHADHNLTNVDVIPAPPLPLGAVPFGPSTPLSLLARPMVGGVSEDAADNDVGGGGFGAPFTLPESRPSACQKKKIKRFSVALVLITDELVRMLHTTRGKGRFTLLLAYHHTTQTAPKPPQVLQPRLFQC